MKSKSRLDSNPVSPDPEPSVIQLGCEAIDTTVHDISGYYTIPAGQITGWRNMGHTS